MKEYITLKLYSSGKEEVIRSNKPPTLEEYQSHVGGLIEVIPCCHEGKLVDMVINEEGKLMQLDVNLKATKLYQMASKFDYVILDGDYVAGDVLVLINHDVA